jgi:methylthioribose-1-phosphate isomerase
MSDVKYDTVRAMEWTDRGLRLLDQRLLPQQQIYLDLADAAAVATAIREMVVRGAPAIGIAAAYGVVLAARTRFAAAGEWTAAIERDLELLCGARPTAVNLAWAIARMRRRIASIEGEPVMPLLAEAHAIHTEDIAANRRMGILGAALIDEPCAVLTHCNTGALATGGYGTALGVIRHGFALGKISRVFADETRPWLQGARLTAWELVQEGIPVTLIVDSAAASLLKQRAVRWVIVGADRIATNGDVANKIGTYALAVLARYHGARFMVVAPTSTIDPALADGTQIPIECRSSDEVLRVGSTRLAAAGAEAWNPAFDVTPAELVDVIVTERGVVHAPTPETMSSLIGAAG